MTQLLLKAAPERLMLTTGHIPNVDAVCYLQPVFQLKERRQTVDRVIAALREQAIEFDAFACRGLSGLLIAPIVAMEMHKTLLVIRKDEKPTPHSDRKVEGDIGARKYVIVDDLISSGNTVKDIIRLIREVSQAECVGIVRYYGYTKMFMSYKDFVTSYAPELLPMPKKREPNAYTEAVKSLRAAAPTAVAVKDGFISYYSYELVNSLKNNLATTVDSPRETNVDGAD